MCLRLGKNWKEELKQYKSKSSSMIVYKVVEQNKENQYISIGGYSLAYYKLGETVSSNRK